MALFHSQTRRHMIKPDTHDETFVCNFCLQLFSVSCTTVRTMKILYATSYHLLLFPAKIMHMHKAFVNMVLTKENKIVVLLCLIVIALSMQHLNGLRIIRSCWTRRWIQRRNVYGAHHVFLEELRNEDPEVLKKLS